MNKKLLLQMLLVAPIIAITPLQARMVDTISKPWLYSCYITNNYVETIFVHSTDPNGKSHGSMIFAGETEEFAPGEYTLTPLSDYNLNLRITLEKPSIHTIYFKK